MENSTYKTLLADTQTPVSIYLKIRDVYPGSILLESSESKNQENNFSYICFNPIAGFEVKNDEIKVWRHQENSIKKTTDLPVKKALHDFVNNFNYREKTTFPFKTHGLFGYIAYDAISYFEDIKFKHTNQDVPSIYFRVYRNVIVFNHFKNQMFLFDHDNSNGSNLDEVETMLHNSSLPKFKFKALGNEKTNFTDEGFIEIVKKGIYHCNRGDVFQIVLSRKFRQSYKGDDFNLYRTLRSVNPSPYLFYCDCNNFRLFGSSPEAQLVINRNKAVVNPIAGTFRRTGNEQSDIELAEKLIHDPKENAEHVMLVDLARNDLSLNCNDVQVEKYREIEYFSHVIHLVSRVVANLEYGYNPIEILVNTFPAGTLSGAPKYRAMELIDEYENEARGIYGGCVGMIGFDGTLNMAIIIRTFLSKNNQLEYQAGAGVVSASHPESELQEVNNKLLALRTAIDLANEI